MQRLSQIRPDVIFCTPYEMNFYDLDELRRIAPTEVIPWMEMDWKGHLRTLADCLGAGRKAEKWISRFEFRADSTEKNIRQLIGYTSVSVLHFIRGELVVYGDRNGGSVFFHELGIRSSYPLEDITVYQKLNEDEIQKYAGDITVICVDNDSRSKKRLNQLLASPEWKDFNDHHDTRMYICKDDPWVDYCALSHASILNRINMMFG
ncbi:MAG: ABC transporter substrate-binding protein [Solobacterium sp.]|nr:ABC transporter substrate-binding protein [Solobacterium sp.]